MTARRAVSLRFGHHCLDFSLPAHADVLTPREPEQTVSRQSFLAGLQRLLPPMLDEHAIAVVVADKTRLCDYPTALPWLVEALLSHGAARSRITFFIAYGTHAPQSEAESLAAYGSLYREYPFIHHLSTAEDLFVTLGHTSRGTPVRVRRELTEAGLIVTVGAISHHYFAGFGGGRKLLFPGLGEQEAIFANHQLFLDCKRRILAPVCRPGQLSGNPLAEDLAEIERMLPPYLAIHGLPDSRGRIAAFRFGTTAADFNAACREHDRLHRAACGQDYDLVLASAGGFPKDINLIQSHKAIDNAAAFVRDGGELILLAQCADGIGSTTLLPYFAWGSREAAFAQLAARYSGNGGTALALMTKTERVRISLVTDLDDALCRRIGVQRISLEEAKQHAGTAGNLAVIANGSMLIR